jgi:hypothetical protein
VGIIVHPDDGQLLIVAGDPPIARTLHLEVRISGQPCSRENRTLLSRRGSRVGSTFLGRLPLRPGLGGFNPIFGPNTSLIALDFEPFQLCLCQFHLYGMYAWDFV